MHGFLGYYRQFVTNFSKVMHPITQLFRDGVPFEWSDSCDKAFVAVPDSLLSDVVLHFPDLNMPFIIETDASYTGIGAILSQETDGRVRPIYFASRCLVDAETRYPPQELECLAIWWACRKFKSSGDKFVLFILIIAVWRLCLNLRKQICECRDGPFICSNLNWKFAIGQVE